MMDKEKIDAPINKYWRAITDFVTYKAPFAIGKALLPDDVLDPEFVLNQNEVWYGLDTSRKDKHLYPDFYDFTGDAFFVTERAYEVMKDMFLRESRAFEVMCNKKPHYIIPVYKAYPAFDLDNSNVEWADSVTRPGEKYISRIFHLALRNDFSTEDHMFRVIKGYGKSLDIVVSDAFKARVEQHGLTGLIFRPTTPYVKPSE